MSKEAVDINRLEMGAVYSENSTIFRVFSPDAIKLYVNIYDKHEKRSPSSYEMKRLNSTGIWETEVQGNFLNKYYKYHVVFKNAAYKAMDPYSKCCDGSTGRCIITSDKTIVSKGPEFSFTDAIIYEIHIRDITIDKNSGIKKRGKYIGLTEYPTHLKNDKNITTGLAHIEELGVNVVQIMPVHDFYVNENKNEYAWGYMPLHYNSPAGWYASRKDDTTRIIELKKMISVFHEKNIKVIMDVVYNHTDEGHPERKISFNALAPDYYYRVKEDGTYWNGSGCGNEFRSEAPMARKYIIDSLKYWVKEYDIDGFRFDLMALTDIDTLKLIVEQLRKFKSDILIYGEPWTCGPTPISPIVKGKQKGLGFGCFNDHIRDGLRGDAFIAEDMGFIQSGRNIDRIKRSIEGSINDFAAEPHETINYAAAHDNHTLWDKIILSTQDYPDITDNDRKDMDKLAAAIVLTSQGIPFIHGGQDFLRTKQKVENSYNAPDNINMFDWKRKKDNIDIFNYYKGLISLRKRHPLFRLKTAEEIRKSLFFLDDDLNIRVPEKCIGYILKRQETYDEWENILLLFNPNPKTLTFAVPVSEWYIVVDKYNAGTEPLNSTPVVSDRIEAASRSALIMFNIDPSFSLPCRGRT